MGCGGWGCGWRRRRPGRRTRRASDRSRGLRGRGLLERSRHRALRCGNGARVGAPRHGLFLRVALFVRCGLGPSRHLGDGGRRPRRNRPRCRTSRRAAGSRGRRRDDARPRGRRLNHGRRNDRRGRQRRNAAEGGCHGSRRRHGGRRNRRRQRNRRRGRDAGHRRGTANQQRGRGGRDRPGWGRKTATRGRPGGGRSRSPRRLFAEQPNSLLAAGLTTQRRRRPPDFSTAIRANKSLHGSFGVP